MAAALAALSCFSISLSAATLNVPANFPTIQAAITAAANGDEVLVEPGVYVGTVSLLGKGITVRSSQGAQVTIIQAPNTGVNVVSFTRGEPPTAAIDGFTIRGGNRGVNMATTLASVRNCIIHGNASGMFLFFASPTIQGNTIVSNTSNGGIQFQGGAAQVIGNNISYNIDTSAGGGAAMELFEGATPTIRNNLISFNSAPSGGGGIITLVSASDPLIEQNLIVRNDAGTNGTIAWLVPSGVTTPRVINNTIAFNTSTLAAGIAANAFDSSAQIVNNIIYASGSQTGIWVGSADANLPVIQANLVFSESGARYNGIASDQTGINGNISGDPQFANVPNNDFHLRSTSPAIDVALAAAAPTVDFAGLTRPVDGNGDGTAEPDLGVYEFLGVNHPPVADAKALDVAEDTSGTVQLTGSDPDGDALTFQVTSNPAHGTISANGQSVVYTPEANYNGADSFTYIVNDSQNNSDPATVSITVTPVNDVPTAVGAAYTTPEDTARALTLVAFDVDNEPLIYVIATTPQHGTLSGTGANLTYTPAANFNGSDSFDFFVQDAVSASAPATISITVTSANDAPTANSLALSVSEDSSVAVTLSGSDADNDSLTFRVLTQPAHGTLSVSNGQVAYTPAANFNGPDEFTYVANDGTIDSAPATVALTVQPVNDVPVANSQAYSTPEDQPFTFTLSGSDVDGDTLTHRIITPPAHGSLSVTGNTIQFVPEPNFNGSDHLEFVLSDGQSESTVARIDITITPANDAPVAINGAFSGPEDSSIPIALSASDLDGDALTFVIVSGPEHGTLSGSGANLTYQPAPNFNGGDSFTWKANDGTADSAVATVFLAVTPVNDPPVATSRTVFATEDQPFTSVVSGTDVDGDALTFSLKEGPAHGTVSGEWPAFTYTPAPNYSGPDSFRFFVSDGQATSHGTMSIVVTPVNDVPVAQSQSILVHEDKPTEVTLSASDVDGHALSYSILTPPAHGTLSGTAPNLVYTPAANFFGTDSFTFRASDAISASEPATVTITVKSVNDAPTFTFANTTLHVRKNAGGQTFLEFIRNISAGPNESDQTVSLAIIGNTNPDLFQVQPELSSKGTLTFDPRQGRTGTASITVKALDNGGTADCGIDRSTQCFTIIVDNEMNLQSVNKPLSAARTTLKKVK